MVFGGRWHLEADALLGDELGADAGRQLGLEARGHAGEKGLENVHFYSQIRLMDHRTMVQVFG